MLNKLGAVSCPVVFNTENQPALCKQQRGEFILTWQAPPTRYHLDQRRGESTRPCLSQPNETCRCYHAMESSSSLSRSNVRHDDGDVVFLASLGHVLVSSLTKSRQIKKHTVAVSLTLPLVFTCICGSEVAELGEGQEKQLRHGALRTQNGTDVQRQQSCEEREKIRRRRKVLSGRVGLNLCSLFAPRPRTEPLCLDRGHGCMRGL